MVKNKIAGLILIVLNIYYLFCYARLWYLYEFTDILWYMMYPTWEILMNLAIGILGIYAGMKVYDKSATIVKGASLSLALMLMSQIVHLATNL